MFQIFKSVLLLSGIGTFFICILLILKPLAGKVFSAKWQYYIWLVALIAMVMPVYVRLPKKSADVNIPVISAEPAAEFTAAPDADTYTATEAPLPEQVIDVPAGETVTVAELEKKDFDLNIFDLAAIIWISGVCVFLLCAMISYMRFLRYKRRNSVPVDEYIEFTEVKKKLNIKRHIPLKKSDDLTAPMLVGVIKPVIYVPDRDIGSKALTMIFMHELTHYKRHDLLYKWFSLLVNALHWFNPFAYIAARNINQACELSCDESVTKDMSDEEKRLYMQTILGLIQKD